MKMRIASLCAGALVLAFGLAACGEKDQVVMYKQGKYQGKPDTKPYDNPGFEGDKARWEGSIKSRNQNQNEYRRMPG